MSFTKVTSETVAGQDEVAQRVSRLRLVGGDTDTAATHGADSGAATAPKAKYPAYLPVWTKSEFPPWQEVPYTDAGHRATPDKRHLFKEGSTHRQITPAIGEEIHGVQLSKLSKEGLDDLALLAAERGLLIL